MMQSGPGILSFLATIAGLSLLTAALAPRIVRRLSVRTSLLAIGLVGPLLGVIAGLVAMSMMAFQDDESSYLMMLLASLALAAAWTAVRLGRPLAEDLEQLRATTRAVAAGDRSTRTGIVRDDEVGHLAAELDALVAELQQAESERSAIAAERRHLVDGLAHDLRTPLQALLATAEAIGDGLLPPDEAPEAVHRQVATLQRLLGDLLVLARVEAGTLELHIERLDLAELVDDAIALATPVASNREVALRADITGPVIAEVDPDQVGRVLRNLLDNAIRHTPTGGTVEVRLCPGAEGRAEIEVLDEGPGFPAAMVEEAFQPSVSGGGSTRPGAEGLGLAIARGVVEAHGGAIAARPGPGGSVTVRL
ncbi:MAG: HAMP domain-containing sensor histidine kinase [Actinomycetota bacterium]